MAKTICRICLRTDLRTRNISETLVDFHDEITEYAVFENEALKYCLVCEHLLLKFYKFHIKCRQANKILKKYKKKEFPSNLYELLPPTSFYFSTPFTLQEFYLNDGKLEPYKESDPIHWTVKQEVNPDEIDFIKLNQSNDTDVDMLQTDTPKFSETDILDDSGNVKVFITTGMVSEEYKEINSVAEIDNTLKGNKEIAKKSVKRLHLTSELTEMTHEQQNDLKIKLEDDCSDFESNYIDEDSSESVISEFEKQITIPSMAILRKNGKPRKQRSKKPLKNLKEFATGFEIQVFATEQDAIDELEQRKHTEPYLSAEHKCEICYTVYKYRKLLEFHMRWHDPSIGDHECFICRMRFKTRKAVVKHKYGSHYGKFKCKRCPMITYHKAAMETHYQYHEGTIYACKLCDHTFQHSSTLKTHIRTQHKTEHVCVTCARTFVSEKGLYAHRNIVHKTKSLVDSEATAHCEPCGLTFANREVYTIHIKNTDKHKDLANAIIACKVCGLRFENKNCLKQHTRSEHLKYSSEKPAKTRNTLEKDAFKCYICGVVGTSRLWVYKHVAFAHPDSPYAADLKRRRRHMCHTCGKCYTTVYALRDHMNIHTGAKPYACSVCPSRFACRTNLQIHADKHAPARRECSRCGKKFISASNLSNHMRSHIQDRRYKCFICHKGFLHAPTLREHIRGVHHNIRRTRKLVKKETVAHES